MRDLILFVSSLVPIFAYVALFINLKPRTDWRHAFLWASVIWGLLVAIFTEIPGFFSMIGYRMIAALWGLTFVGALVYWIMRNRSQLPPRLSWLSNPFSPFEWILLAATMGIVLSIGFIAWYAAPTTWDSMTYHLPRIMHWVQNKSVDFYPTHILRQLHMNPWSGYAMMQFQIVRRDDRFANFVQWFSMVGSLIGVSLIARQSGAILREQVAVVVVAATIPMGIVQASSTQNDYVVTFWLVCFVYFGLGLLRELTVKNAFYTGCALGLAILTKATAYLFAFPFLLWICLSVLKKSLMKSSQTLVIIAILALTINAPFYIRNYEMYGSPLGPGQESSEGNDYANDIFTAPALASNLIRNIGVHLATPYKEINQSVEKSIYAFHELIGISPNDPRTTWTGAEFHIAPIIVSDIFSTAFIHLFLIFISAVIYLKQKTSAHQSLYLVALVGGFIFFSTYLKWQPWHSRLHLPLFVLWTPFIGIVLSRVKNQTFFQIILLALLIVSVPWITSHNLRPLLGPNNIVKIDRTKQILRDTIRKPYTLAANSIIRKQCYEVGLISGINSGEYPLWVLLQKNGQPFRLEHVNVTNVSGSRASLPLFSSFTPCVVLIIEQDFPESIVVGDTVFFREKIFNQVGVYSRE